MFWKINNVMNFSIDCKLKAVGMDESPVQCKQKPPTWTVSDASMYTWHKRTIPLN